MKTILSFGAHPDDIEIDCGGTERKLVEQGFKATHVYVTSGEAGSNTVEQSTLAGIREHEARKAALALGVEHVEFQHAPDGLTEFTRELKIAVINIIREIRPEIIFVHASTDTFPNHQVVHALVMSAIIGAALSLKWH